MTTLFRTLIFTTALLAMPGAAFADSCAGAAHCYDAGPFAADVGSLSPSWNKYHNQHFLRLNLRFRNTGTVPLILGFRWGGAATLTDNYGNSYTIDGNNYRASVSGIGLISRDGADTGFLIAPGASRSASLIFNRWLGKTGTAAAVGNAYTADFAVEQLQVLQGSQRVQVAGQYSLNFPGLSGGLPGSVTPGVSDIGEGIGALVSAFGKKK
jgi:hypothetical protein